METTAGPPPCGSSPRNGKAAGPLLSLSGSECQGGRLRLSWPRALLQPSSRPLPGAGNGGPGFPSGPALPEGLPWFRLHVVSSPPWKREASRGSLNASVPCTRSASGTKDNGWVQGGSHSRGGRWAVFRIALFRTALSGRLMVLPGRGGPRTLTLEYTYVPRGDSAPLGEHRLTHRWFSCRRSTDAFQLHGCVSYLPSHFRADHRLGDSLLLSISAPGHSPE